MGAYSSNLHNDDLSQTTPKTNATQESVHTIAGHLSSQIQYILAIDIGTMYSGYAYARKDDLNLDTGKINDIWCRQVWNSERANLMSYKTSTCILLNSEKELNSFGFEAEDKFVQIVEDKRQNEYYFFRRFKMVLYDEKITPGLYLTDEVGKKLPAKIVFGKSILALKQHFFKNRSQCGQPIESHAVRYVLTVPAIWGDAAKQFMRDAAIEAGIKTEEMLIVLEPEAASIYNQFLKLEDINDFELIVPELFGSRYIVADLGAGTVDIVVHQILLNGFVKETHRCRGNDCGGDSVNIAFLELITGIIGKSVLREIRKKDPSTLVEFHREIETAKKSVDGKENNHFKIRLPHHFVDGFINEKTGKNIESLIKQSKYDSKMEIKHGYLCVEQALVIETCFKSTKDKIMQLINQAVFEVERHTAKQEPKIKKILLVGGFSNSKYIQNAVRENYPAKQVIIPEAADLCVLKGAVLFGHSPYRISHRVVRFTYGIETSEPFNPGEHDEKHKYVLNGEEQCDNLFCTYVSIGSVVEIGKTITKKLYAISPYQKNVQVTVFTSLSSNPKYTDEDDCEKVGTLTVNIQNPSEKEREFDVSLVFGNTEIQVLAKDALTRKKETATIDFILY